MAKKTQSSPVVIDINRKPSTEEIELSNDGNRWVKMAEKISIRDQESYKKATEMLVDVVGAEKRKDAEKDKMIKPLNQALRVERERWKPLEAIIEKVKSLLKTKMREYIDEVEMEERKIQQKFDEGKIKKESTLQRKLDELPPVPAKVVSDSGASSVSKVRKVVIENESLIPREYLVVDMVKLRRDVLSGKEVPGAKIVLENQISIFS